MILLDPKQSVLSMVALVAAALLCAGCGDDGLSVLAGNCWGQASQDCREEQNPVLRALGYEGAELVALTTGFTCGDAVDCKKALASRTASGPSRPKRPASASSSPPAVTEPGVSADSANSTPPAGPGGDDAAVAAAVDAAPAKSATPADSATTVPFASATVAAEEKVAAAPAGSGACKGINIPSLEQRSDLTGPEKTCLMDAALGKAGVSDPDIQVAVISLYNTRSAGWEKAVEAALRRKNLTNAPNLNFAGIKPAYDGNKYSTVIARSNIVWRNLKKGYSLSAVHLSFVTEYACRSALQLHLMQKPDRSGLDWCERWRSRLTKAGAPTGDVDDILDQLEE